MPSNTNTIEVNLSASTNPIESILTENVIPLEPIDPAPSAIDPAPSIAHYNAMFSAITRGQGVAPAPQEESEPVPIYHDTIADLRIKYENCYGLYKGKLIFIDSFFTEEDSNGYSTGRLMCNYTQWTGMNYTLEIEGILEMLPAVDWTLPILGAINYHDTVIFLSRRHKQSSPSRYRKAFRFDIVHAFEPNCKEYNILERVPLTSNNGVSRKIVHKIFFREYFTPKEALEQVLSLKRLGAAFSHDYYITLSSSTNSFLLWRGDIIVGTYSKTHARFKLITNMFKEELLMFDLPLIEAE